MDRSRIIRQSLLFLGIGAWVFLFLSLASFHASDWPSHQVYPYPPIQNLCGPTGSYVAYYCFLALGEGLFPVLFLTGVGLAMVMFKQRVQDLWIRSIGLLILSIAFASLVHHIQPGSASALPEGHGGIVGIGTSTWLQLRFHTVGTRIVLFTLMLIGLLLAADELVLHTPAVVTSAIGKVKEHAPSWRNWKIVPLPALPRMSKFVTKETVAKPAKPKKAIVKVVKEEEAEDEEEKPVESKRKAAAVEDIEEDEEPEKPAAVVPAAPIRKDIIVRLPSAMKPRQVAPPPPKELGEYHLPNWDVLDDAEYGFAATQETFVRQMAAILEKSLQEFNIDAHVVEIDTGPVITVYELALAPGVKVSTISALTNDIQRALKAETIRIVAPIPGKNTVGIEVPNAQKEKVRLKELMQLAPDALNKMAVPLFLGKDSSGSPLVDDLTRMPHLLIAGTTGSGKSVCINSIIMSIMYRQRPDMVKLILVDPKVVEMASFKEIPHLMCPVINDSARACSVLEWACEKMDERYEFLAEAGVRNIKGYNSLTTQELVERFHPATPEEEARIPKKLPYIVIIVDELADLMMTSGKEVESHIVRLAQKARAVGIHLILATQRPQATVVTGLIKANMPAKIAFRVSSKMDSRIVLDMNGAEVLLGQGDMLYLQAGASKPIRSQGTFIDDKETRESVKLVCNAAEQQFEPELVQIKATGNIDEGAAKDDLFDQAVRVVLETKRGSVSLLQRRLTIGYSRASRLIEAMAVAGIVGDYKGSQAREALITVEQWDAMHQQQQIDEQSGMTV
ncbi:MAG TPA: DNA translocase FtsK [Tepidisphaeraceae bacterium]|nr:DNA translocase FtsK [Tepidisphaeraceae bacterium]